MIVTAFMGMEPRFDVANSYGISTKQNPDEVNVIRKLYTKHATPSQRCKVGKDKCLSPTCVAGGVFRKAQSIEGNAVKQRKTCIDSKKQNDRRDCMVTSILGHVQIFHLEQWW